MTLRWKPIAAAVAAFLGTIFVARKVTGPTAGAGPYRTPGGNPLPVDPYAPHEPASSFDPTPKPGALMFREWAIGKWGERPGSPQNIGRWDKTDKPSEHHEGRAWDLMTTSIAHGDSIVEALLASEGTEPHALARRAGIMYLIWNKRIWRAYPYAGKAGGEWAPYTGPNPHTDHIHFSFSKAGGAGLTSLYQSIKAQQVVV